jgi:hypothetical protein
MCSNDHTAIYIRLVIKAESIRWRNAWPLSERSIFILESNFSTTQYTTNSNQPAMAVGAFPSLNSVRDIREFDGSPEKLVDFSLILES